MEKKQIKAKEKGEMELGKFHFKSNRVDLTEKMIWE